MRLIDADALLEQMKRRKDYVGRPSDPVCLVEDAPTVDAVPVKHGWWKDSIACSNCGWMMIDDILESRWLVAFPYCPNCGAKMDGERQEGE